MEKKKSPLMKAPLKYIYVAILSLFVIYSIVFFCILLSKYIKNQEQNDKTIQITIEIINNSMIALYFLVTELIIHFKFSGSPYKSPEQKNQLKQLHFILFYLVFSRLLELAINAVLYEIDFPQDDNSLSNGAAIILLLGYVAEILICEIIPFLILLS